MTRGQADPMVRPFGMRDVSEIAVGSVILAFPVSLSEEVWNIGAELSVWRAFMISLGSVVFITWFGYHRFYAGNVRDKRLEFFIRVLTVYFVTVVVAGIILLSIDRLELFVDPVVALKRTLIVAFPASFSATVVDSIR